MEQYELELLEKYAKDNPELQQLWQEHQEFEKKLEKLEGKRFLTPHEETELRDLKKRKLAGKTRIQNILEEYRKSEAQR
jgi:hypothetical protein